VSRIVRLLGRLGLAAALARAGVSSAIAGDSADPIAAARRLAEQAATIDPLPDSGSGITRDVGAIAIIEHDGSDYSWKDADGTPNYAARARVTRRFYQTHGDNYDFLVVFTNFEFATGDALAFHNLVRNDVRGIGSPITDSGELFGSPDRLRGYVDMAALARYARPPYTLTPGTPGFGATINVLAHELAHQWLAQVRYRDGAGQASGALLGREGSHWSYLLDSDASVMYGADWIPTDDGNFVASRVMDSYSALDLYLMGLLDPARVGPITLLRNPAVDPLGVPSEGARVTAQTESISVDQIQAVEGPRSPDHRFSPKTFRVGFVFLTKPGTEPSSEDLDAVERVRQAFTGHFFALTRGVALADTSLAEAAPVTHAPAPDLDRALAWLLARQTLDGAWEDAPATAIRDTTAVLEALGAASNIGPPYQRGAAFLSAAAAPNGDFEARRAAILAITATPAARAGLVSGLLARQNEDGGWGIASGYASSPLDTALTLRALYALGHPLDPAVRKAAGALSGLRAASGAWPAIPGGDPSTVASAHVLLALQDWSESDEMRTLIAPGLAGLLMRRNPDGGFGESPSTSYGTALALQALLRGGADAGVVEEAIRWLQASQLPDGSWDSSAYDTALVLRALNEGLSPNLVVAPDGVAVEPPAVHEGETVRVTAHVRNVGRTPADASIAKLYDGDPATMAALASAAVPALSPAQEASIDFSLSTQGRLGTRVLFVVADADGAVKESREDDNAASRSLRVDGLLPDLVVAAGGIVVSPYPPEEGETAEVTIMVRNVGAGAALPTTLHLFRGNPRLAGVVIGSAPIAGLASGGSATGTIAWDTTGLHGDFVLYAVADSTYMVAESTETNNETTLDARVIDALPPGPDIELYSLVLDPAALSIIPEQVEFRAVVRNLGRDAADTTVALVGPDGTTLHAWPVSIPGRSTTTVSATLAVTKPGSQTFEAVADPAETLVETSESNNRAAVVLSDPATTVDLEVRPDEVTTSSADVIVGQVLTVDAVVHNRGTAAVVGIPLTLLHVTATGTAELTRTLVSVPGGGSVTAQLGWTTAFVSDAAALRLMADPFALLSELSESNNAVDLTVRIRPSGLPNLIASGGDIAFDPDPPLEGGATTITALVRNNGTVAAGPFAVRFFRGDPAGGGTLIAERQVPGLDALGSITFTVDWTADVRGAQGIFVVADAAGEVTEYDESDNQGFRPFSVVGLPDLVLAAGDVVLQPPFPRAGQAVSVKATVRNLGGQIAPPSVVRAFEGEPSTGLVIGELAVPALGPGQFAALETIWSPASPPGERRLSLAADAGGIVVEQDEGNNLARRTVVVQDADLSLTAPYISPNGDGVQEETTLTYRATGSVEVVVVNARGKTVRRLVEAAPASGSVTWDGRDERGQVTDGRYGIRLLGDGGVTLGEATVAVDTNRSTLHDVIGTRLTTTRNIGCQLNGSVRPVWTPAEDEVLLINIQASPPPGLLRATMDGVSTYIGQEAWYQAFDNGVQVHQPDFLRNAVAPDGRYALATMGSHDRSTGVFGNDLWRIDLMTGQRLLLRADAFLASWSPDGRHIVVQVNFVDPAMGAVIITPDGAEVAWLPYPPVLPGWVWSPDSEFLASGDKVYRRDGTFVRSLELPPDAGPLVETTWRTDGVIVVRSGTLAETGWCLSCPWSGQAQTHPDRIFLVNPETGEAKEATSVAGFTPANHIAMFPVWSPDGGRMLYVDRKDFSVKVVNEDGTGLRQVLPPRPGQIGFSPLGTAAAYPQSGVGACAGTLSDYYVIRTLQNLAVDLRAGRLPANNGILVTGTVADLNLDRYQLEYARQVAPETWYPIGPASEVAVKDDVLATWVPPSPGTYLLRLKAIDRAGNSKSRVRVVTWDRVPPIVNVTQTETLISPNEDGVKDAVTFDYLVVEPTRVSVVVSGPAPPSGSTPPIVRRLTLESSTTGPASFNWDGRDDLGQVVPDGRYTVAVNAMPFRVDVDATPPDIAWSYAPLETRVEKRPSGCGTQPIDTGALVAERLWHVVDSQLKRWSGPGASGNQPVYEAERDASGQILYDGDGVARILLVDGQAVDRRDADPNVTAAGVDPDAAFTAEDFAGNRSTVSVAAVPERLFLLEGRPVRCDALVSGQGRILPPIDPGRVYLLQDQTTFQFAETLRNTPEDGETIRFQYRPLSGGAWIDAAEFKGGGQFGWTVDLRSLGIPAGTYRARFATGSGTREFLTEEFSFTFCPAVFTSDPPVISPIPGTTLANYTIRVEGKASEELVAGSVTVVGDGRLTGFHASGALAQITPGTFNGNIVAPQVSCEPGQSGRLSFAVSLTGNSGRIYEDDGSCARLRFSIPICPFGIMTEQEFPYCEGNPNDVHLGVRGTTATLARLRVERGPPEAPVSILEATAEGGFEESIVHDVTGTPEGSVALRSRLLTASDPPLPLAQSSGAMVVDRTPAAIDVIRPAEGAEQCLIADTSGREIVEFVIDGTDAGDRVQAADPSYETGGAAGFSWSCLQDDESCRTDWAQGRRLPTGVERHLGWNAAGVADGTYTVRLPFCDRAGNRTSVTRTISLVRRPPNLTYRGLSQEVFSPNGDGVFDQVTATVRIVQGLRLTVTARQGSATGTVVRTLFSEQPYPPGEPAFVWDGRNSAGQVVPDGKYFIVVSGLDSCGRAQALPFEVHVDTTAPRAEITRPVAGELVGVGVDVTGFASDANLESYELEVISGSGSFPVASGGWPVNGGVLGRWDTPDVEGAQTLRLVVKDAAGNQSVAQVTVTVRSRSLLGRLAAEPEVFSPNADGRKETTTIQYVLLDEARITLEVRGASGALLRTLESHAARTTGVWNVVWDGRTDAGTPAAEGAHQVVIQAEAMDGSGVQQEGAQVAVDRTPPAISISRPSPGAFLTRADDVEGTVSDEGLTEYVVSASPGGGPPIELARRASAPTDGRLAALSSLTEGAYSLTVTASDLAANESTRTVPFTIDNTPPTVSLRSPEGGSVLRHGTEGVPVIGSVEDANLQSYVLSLGAGAAPALFTDLARGTSGGTDLALGFLPVTQLADGTYTLRLVGTDNAGQSSEARLTVSLDGTLPEAALLTPADGGYVSRSAAVVGTAADANLDSWELEAAPGPAATAFQWAQLASGTTSVSAAALLASWAPLPADGTHTLRLIVRDKAGQSATALSTVTVDTIPPAAPKGLAADVRADSSGTSADVGLTWSAGTEPDLVGYRVLRGTEPLPPDIHAQPSVTDGGRQQGIYRYSVLAVDMAGNTSEPALLSVTVDLSPPLVDILSPAANEAVSGSTDIRGTAFSADDFKLYRLQVGTGDPPAYWTPIAESTVPVSAAILGTWVAIGSGPHVVSLEAEDVRGNRAIKMVRVIVDNEGPEAPVLSTLAVSPDDVSLTATWQPSSSSDVAGYLVYRNGQIANSIDVALGDLRPFLVAGPSYADGSLPDGRHCYRVVAMDRAGNVSGPSNERCQTLDNNYPRATIIEPKPFTSFDTPLRIAATSPDQDITSVEFQFRPASGDPNVWTAIGGPDTQSPFEATLDTATLSPGGAYNLRAVATDTSGRTDPAPAFIRVFHGDVTPPRSPQNLSARVDGATVRLTWAPVTDADDLAGYYVYRDGKYRGWAEVPAFDDTAVPVGAHVYTVTAADLSENESLPSNAAPATVYRLVLEIPPLVTDEAAVTLRGQGALPGTTVQILRDGAVIAEVAVTGAIYSVPDVPLVPGGNVLAARGRDARDNRSIPSAEVVVISSAPPPGITGLAAAIAGHAVDLSWDAVTSPDLVGYAVRRDGTSLTSSSEQRSYQQVVGASLPFYGPDRALDGELATVWVPPVSGALQSWTVTYASAIPVQSVRLSFAYAGGLVAPIATYRIEVLWQGRYVPMADVSGNTATTVTHTLPKAFSTNSVRVVVPGAVGPDYRGIAEVVVTRRDLVSTASFRDSSVPDGRHRYEVTAVDRYGAEGAPGSVEVAVGDLEPPAIPVGLAAMVRGRDVLLSWAPNSEPDVATYAVVRDGVGIGSTATAAFRDPSLANGIYVYEVFAVDASGNESAPSAPASATVAWTRPPVIVLPTDARHPVALDSGSTTVAGGAEAGSIVALEVNGTVAGATTATTDAGAVMGETRDYAIPSDAFAITFSPDGRSFTYGYYDGDGYCALMLVESATGQARRITQPGYADTVCYIVTFAPDGRRLAFPVVTDVGGIVDSALVVLDLDTDQRTQIDARPDWYVDAAWSPDGKTLAYAFYVANPEGVPTAHLGLRDILSGTTRLLATPEKGVMYQLRWSPDGRRLAHYFWIDFVGVWLRLIDAQTGVVTVLESDAAADDCPLAWLPDGRKLLYTSATGGRFFIAELDLDTQSKRPLTDLSFDAFDGRVDANGRWLSFNQVGGGTSQLLREMWVKDLATGQLTQVTPPVPLASFDAWSRTMGGHQWLDDGQLALGVLEGSVRLFDHYEASFAFEDVRLREGENVLVARATDPTNGDSTPSGPVRVTVGAQDLPDLEVLAGDVATYPPVPVPGQSALVTANVRNRGAQPAAIVAVRLSIEDAAGTVVFVHDAEVAALGAAQSAPVSGYWTPSSTGGYVIRVEVDAEDRIIESREDNNRASRQMLAIPAGAIDIDVAPDRTAYPAQTAASLTVRLVNGGPAFSGSAITTVTSANGTEVARIDTRAVSLAYGHDLGFVAAWNTGVVLAGDYRFQVELRDSAGTRAGEDSAAFQILPDLVVSSRLVPTQPNPLAGAPVDFDAGVENRGLNVVLDGYLARLTILAADDSSPIYESDTSIGSLLPGGSWQRVLTWPVAGPAGSYRARLAVIREGVAAASAETAITVQAPPPGFRGTLELAPAGVLRGDAAAANLTLSNGRDSAVSAQPFAVQVTSAGIVVQEHSLSVDLAAGQTQSATLPLSTDLAPGLYPVLLRSMAPAQTLARATLHVHGAIIAPSMDSPADGARVPTVHPVLMANNGVSQDGSPLTYTFELYADAALTQRLPGATGVAEGVARTSWTVPVALAEDGTFFWRVRAADDFSVSSWTPAASFTVDEINRTPEPPVPDTPPPGARVASASPTLTAVNGRDPEADALVYDFRLAADAGLSAIIASTSGVAEGVGLTAWAVPVVLEENATYYWSVRTRDAFGASPWSVPIAFMVDTVNESPSAPPLVSPVGGAQVATVQPTLVAGRARDPEADVLRYRFEVDVVPSFDSPGRQVSPELAAGEAETAWAPPQPLADNTRHHWRASATDGNTAGPWATTSFFVNLANDPPGVPEPIEPPDQGTVGSATPTLVARNTSDVDGDALSYEFTVTDETGALVASSEPIPQSPMQTSWTVPAPLEENGQFSWQVRASDGQTVGGWSAASRFRINAILDPPTAPALVAPPEGALIEEPAVTLVVANATSVEGLPLAYEFELSLQGPDGMSTLFDRMAGVPEGGGSTAWTPTRPLVDGVFSWRARAVDQQPGPWMPSAHFRVALDAPPSPPAALSATPGDAKVALAWTASSEADVHAYRVYRGHAPGGPYERVAEVATTTYEDGGLTNGVTVFYVVTAVDARFESPYSVEVAATPRPARMEAEVTFVPARIAGECLYARDRGIAPPPGTCPLWIESAIELPAGNDPATVDASTVRLAGSIAADPSYRTVADVDGDGVAEANVRFAFADASRVLAVGRDVLLVTGRAGGVEFYGSGTIDVAAVGGGLWMTPRTLQRRSQGQAVLARITLALPVRAADIDLSTLRLNGVVPVMRTIVVKDHELTAQFDRAAVIAILEPAEHVAVRVTGRIAGLPFEVADVIRVIK
jgi:subtilase family serine protease/Tol biopolymer transport system component/fibronectin type 3 domain-containing protein